MADAAKIRQRLEYYYEAERKTLQAQEYTVEDKELKRARLKEIRETIKDLEQQLEGADTSGPTSRMRVQRVLFTRR